MIFIIKRLQYVILLVAGVFILSVYGQPANVVLEDTTFSTTEYVQATNSITAGPNVTVTSSGDLTLEAPSVGLQNTVFVLNGGKLLILSDNTVVNVKSDGQITPKDYVLNQNYPNPFNPTTSISYYVPKESHISIVVFDLLGRQVRKLVNEIKKAGYHRIEFDATELPSGIYFYRLQAGNFVQTKKMTLLK